LSLLPNYLEHAHADDANEEAHDDPRGEHNVDVVEKESCNRACVFVVALVSFKHAKGGVQNRGWLVTGHVLVALKTSAAIPAEQKRNALVFLFMQII